MNFKKVLNWIYIILLPLMAVQSARAQLPSAKCLANIQNQLDRFSSFGSPEINQIVKKFEFGRPADLADPAKAKAFSQVFESLSEFCHLCGNDLTEKGIEGYIKFSGCLIRYSDDAASQLSIKHLKEAFTEGGVFNGKNFDDVMGKLADETTFAFDAASKTFTSKSSGLTYGNGVFRQGELNSINHIARGHIKNSFSVSDGKSLFADPSEIFKLIDEVWLSPSKVPFGNNGWILDFSPKIVGTRGETKIRIHIDGNVVRSGFPIP